MGSCCAHMRAGPSTLFRSSLISGCSSKNLLCKDPLLESLLFRDLPAQWAKVVLICQGM